MSNLAAKKINTETLSAIFVIIFMALFLVANLTYGFIWPLYILAMLIGLGLSIIYPRSGVYAIVFLTVIFEKFFTLSSLHIGRVEYKIYPLDYIYLGILISVFYQIILGRIKLVFKKAEKIFLGFLALNILVFIFSVFIKHFNFALAFSTFKNYTFYSLFYFVIIFLFNEEKYIRQLFKFFLAGALAIIIFIIIGLARGEGLWIEFNPLSTEGVRTLGFAHGLYLSLALISILIWLIIRGSTPLPRRQAGLNQNGPKRSNLFVNSKFWQAIIFIWAIGIMGTLMRHIWLAVLLTLIALYIFIPRENKIRMRKLAYSYLAIFALLLVIVVYISAMFPQSKVSDYKNSITEVVLNRAKSINKASDDESLSWRKLVWKGVYDNWKTSPLFGIGTGRVIYVETATYKEYIEARNIHNSIFAILLQFGLTGILVFFWFVYENIKNLTQRGSTSLPRRQTDLNQNGPKRSNLFKDYEVYKFILLSLACFYLVVMLFQPYLESNFLGILFWILLGLISAVSTRLQIDYKIYKF